MSDTTHGAWDTPREQCASCAGPTGGIVGHMAAVAVLRGCIEEVSALPQSWSGVGIAERALILEALAARLARLEAADG
jgi:hypothetical protein